MYKIICSQSDCVYIGSTFDKIKNKFYQHKKLIKDGKKIIMVQLKFLYINILMNLGLITLNVF